MPKIGISKILGRPIFQEESQYTQITTINMYLPSEVLHNILIHCHGFYIEVEKIS